MLSFSVNREGSVYEIHDKTRKVLDDFYVQNVKDDVLIYEINADTLGKYEVTLNDQVLKENVDYKVSKEGGNGSWMKYTYAVSRNLFENEGEYILVVSSQDKAGKIDLNTADKALLCTLPGIGESRAESIMAYRQKHGDFQKIEDVMKVSGIKEAAYEKIKDYVTVSK